MKSVTKTTSAGRRLGLAISTIALLGGLSASAANCLIVNETYDPPSLTTPGGWENGIITDLSRQYVSQGVGHSTALQITATFPGTDYAGVFSAMFQSGVMGGNEWATRDNTVLSFDLKIDSPGLSYVGVYLDAFAEYFWNYGDLDNGHGTYSGAVAGVSLGAYQPGVFHKIVLPLNDPRWQQIYRWPDTSQFAPFFDPTSKTYNNVTLFVDSSCLPVPGSFNVTVDNVQISTKNAMVPLQGTGAGEVTGGTDAYILTDYGVAEHIGSYKQIFTLPFDYSPGTVELTAANGDKLIGTFIFGWTEFGVQITKGTGRFEGAVGSYRGVYTWDPTMTSYTATIRGGISTVGSNKN